MTPEELKSYINARVYENNNNEITGTGLNQALIKMVDELGGEGDASLLTIRIYKENNAWVIDESEMTTQEMDEAIGDGTYKQIRIRINGLVPDSSNSIYIPASFDTGGNHTTVTAKFTYVTQSSVSQKIVTIELDGQEEGEAIIEDVSFSGGGGSKPDLIIPLTRSGSSYVIGSTFDVSIELPKIVAGQYSNVFVQAEYDSAILAKIIVNHSDNVDIVAERIGYSDSELDYTVYDVVLSMGSGSRVIYTNGTFAGGGGTPYTLPPATASTLGGVKVGSGVNVAADGTISSDTINFYATIASTEEGYTVYTIDESKLPSGVTMLDIVHGAADGTYKRFYAFIVNSNGVIIEQVPLRIIRAENTFLNLEATTAIPGNGNLSYANIYYWCRFTVDGGTINGGLRSNDLYSVPIRKGTVDGSYFTTVQQQGSIRSEGDSYPFYIDESKKALLFFYNHNFHPYTVSPYEIKLSVSGTSVSILNTSDEWSRITASLLAINNGERFPNYICVKVTGDNTYLAILKSKLTKSSSSVLTSCDMDTAFYNGDEYFHIQIKPTLAASTAELRTLTLSAQ